MSNAAGSSSKGFDASRSRGGVQVAPTNAAAESRPYWEPAQTHSRSVDPLVIDALRASVGPYVPKPWRTISLANDAHASALASVATDQASARSASESLPWIDTFLHDSEPTGEGSSLVAFEGSSAEKPTEIATEIASTPVVFAVPAAVTGIFAAASSAAESAPTEAEASADDALMMPALSDATESADVVAPNPSVDADGKEVIELQLGDDHREDAVDEEWQLADAGAMMESIAADIAAEVPSDQVTVSRITPMPAWSDDDVMDIMPVRAADVGVSAQELWASQARREAQSAEGVEAVAVVLESLAKKVRDGELTLPGYSADLGDAAALAAALAALLGVRR